MANNPIDVDKLLKRTTNSLKAGATQYMKKSGKEKIKDIMVDVMNKRIYNGYTPTKYKRRGSQGGLKDKNNMKDKVEFDKFLDGNVDGEDDYVEITNDFFVSGHLYILNVTPRDESVKLKSKQASSAIAFASTVKDFLFSLKDDPNRDMRANHMRREGVYNLWNSPSWGAWGNMGQPLYITLEVDRRVQNSKEIREGMKQACLKKAKSDMNKYKS